LLDPAGGVLHGLGSETAAVRAAVDFAPEQAGGFQNAQVFRNCGKRDPERRGEFGDGGFAESEAGEDGAAGRIGEGAEGGVERRGRGRARIVNHTVYYHNGAAGCQANFALLPHTRASNR
jgi:hypothetical protein